MSIELRTKAIQDNRTSGAARLVLFILADMANKDGVCWPGYACISGRAGVSRRTAIRAVAWLEEHGFLVVTRRPGEGKQHTSNLYRVCIPEAPGGTAPPGAPPPLPSPAAPTPGVVLSPGVETPGAAAPGRAGSSTMTPGVVSGCDPGSNAMTPGIVSGCYPGSITMIPEPLINHNLNPHITCMPPPPRQAAAEESVLVRNILWHYAQNFGPSPPMEFAAIPRETVRSAAAGLGGAVQVPHPAA